MSLEVCSRRHQLIALCHRASPVETLSKRTTGDLTFYDPALGACGIYSGGGEFVAAIPHAVFDAAQVDGNPNHNPLCGRMIRAGRYDERKGKYTTVDVRVVDKCKCIENVGAMMKSDMKTGMGCAPGDLDLSRPAFNAIADAGRGRVKGDWSFL